MMIWQHLLLVPILLPLVVAIPVTLFGERPRAWLTVAGTLLTLIASSMILYTVSQSGPQVHRIGGWAPPHGIVLVADRFSALLAVVAAVVATAGALHTVASGVEVAHRRLYHPMFLLMLTALGGAFLTGDLFNLYVFMEMVILSSFALVALANRPISAETTFKYAVLTALGSTLFLGGIGLIYASAGTLNMADIAQRAHQGIMPPLWPVAAAILLFVFLLKGAVFPFHFWQPDAHSAAPAAVSAMLSGVLVKVGIYGLVRMTTLLFPETPVLLVLAPLGAVAALFGGLTAVANTDLKRLLAYSTISNVGLIVLALGWGGLLGLTAAIVHTVNHSLIKSSLFLAGGYVTERLDEHGMQRLGGLAHLTPVGTVAFGLGALALAGMPPLNGFVSKFAIFQAGFGAQDPLLLTAAGLAGALGIVYSLRAFVLVFWGETPAWAGKEWARHGTRHREPVAPLFLALGCLALGLWPGPLMGLAADAAVELGQPEIYIAAVLGGEP